MGLEIGLISTIISTAAGVGGTVYSAVQGNKASKAQERANDIKENTEKYEQIKSNRKLVRERRLKLAQLEQQSDSAGVSKSSGELGATSSLATGVNSAIGQAAGSNRASEAISTNLQEAANYQSNAQMGGAVSGIFQTIATGLKDTDFETIFNK